MFDFDELDEQESKAPEPLRLGGDGRLVPRWPLTPVLAVEWIQRAADEFETLMLPLALEDDAAKVRKQYKQLSLLVHPDKNPHPLAATAFKKLFGAMQRLSESIGQRTALRAARRQAAGGGKSGDGGLGGLWEEQWWERATVDEMEKAWRDMEARYEKQGVFEAHQKLSEKRYGVRDDELWISPQESRDLLDKDLALFFDARNASDFQVSHVRGAHSMPGHTPEQLAGFEQTPAFALAQGSPEQSVIIYSDNGSQMSRCALIAARMRQKLKPERVLRLTGGLNQWKRHGFPVDGDPRALFAGKVLGASMPRLEGGE